MSNLVFGWKSGTHFTKRLDAQIAGERLEKIRKKHRGELTADAVLADASNEKSPLHPVFEWNDTKAAHAHRLDQARAVIRAVVVVSEPVDGKETVPVRAFVCVSGTVDDEHEIAANVYRSIEEAMADPTMRAEVLARALGELEAFERKYAALEELAPVFAAARAVVVPEMVLAAE